MKYATFSWRIEGPKKSNLYHNFLKVFHFIGHAPIFHNHELLNIDTKNDVLILLCLKREAINGPTRYFPKYATFGDYYIIFKHKTAGRS